MISVSLQKCASGVTQKRWNELAGLQWYQQYKQDTCQLSPATRDNFGWLAILVDGNLAALASSCSAALNDGCLAALTGSFLAALTCSCMAALTGNCLAALVSSCLAALPATGVCSRPAHCAVALCVDRQPRGATRQRHQFTGWEHCHGSDWLMRQTPVVGPTSVFITFAATDASGETDA